MHTVLNHLTVCQSHYPKIYVEFGVTQHHENAFCPTEFAQVSFIYRSMTSAWCIFFLSLNPVRWNFHLECWGRACENVEVGVLKWNKEAKRGRGKVWTLITWFWVKLGKKLQLHSQWWWRHWSEFEIESKRWITYLQISKIRHRSRYDDTSDPNFWKVSYRW